MPLSSESYRRIASQTGYRVVSLEKVIRLGELLQEIDADPKLVDSLALRGGTALNLELESPPRLSVDLDFDFVGEIEREAMLEAKPEVIQRIHVLSRSMGYRATTLSDAAAGTSIKLDHVNAAGTQDLLKVDISWTNRVGIEPRRRVPLWQPEGVDPIQFTLVGRADLIAGKFRALLDRVAARDVFDAVRIRQSFETEWPPSVIRNAFVFLTGTLDLPLTSYNVERLDRLTEEDFQNNLVPMLTPGNETDRETLIASAKLTLRPLLELDRKHLEFVTALDEGELKPELLFPQEDADRLALHPHLRWKAHNRKEHLNRKP